MKYLFSTLILAATLMSCERDLVSEGPSLTDIYGEFKIIKNLSVTNATPDFKNGEKAILKLNFLKV
ncbi:MAG: hypothetical protein P8I82_03850 [Flavobacteriales bacterium]|nr:hypothetical protein [Flavobacteriales bacterium]